jgi:acetoin utilization deacetylase AcuC-like enzyme
MTESPPRVGFVFDDRYLQHDPGLQLMFETRERLPFTEPTMHLSNYRMVLRAKHLIDLTGLGKDLIRVDAYPATDEQIGYYHLPEYIQLVKDISAAGGGDAGRGTPIAENGYEIAALAAGGGLAAVDAVFDGRVRRVFANVRPPGHHATAEAGMGFCVFNNIVIAARYAQKKYGIERVMVLDWDVHPGNGTQDAFYDDPSVLFFSFHQAGIFPAPLGEIASVGEGAGTGFNVNLAVPAGSGNATYNAAIERIVRPIADEFKPQLVLISAGQDASVNDQLGRNSLTTEGYRDLTKAMIDIAETHADGKLVVLQEGGYSEFYGPYCTLAIVETLMETRTNRPEPQSWEALQQRPESHTVGLSAAAALVDIRETLAPYWSSLTAGIPAD